LNIASCADFAHRQLEIFRAVGVPQRFLQILAEYRQAKDITRKRLLLETLEDILPEMDKIIMENEAGANLLPILPLGKREAQPKLDGATDKR